MKLYDEEFKTFKDIVNRVDSEDVKHSFIELYPEFADNVDKYLELLDYLKTIEPIENDQDDFIIAVDYGPSDVEFNEPGYFRVHGYDENQDYFLGIEYMSWGKWLSKKPDKRFLMTYPMSEYVAHCLWEMTWCGFTPEEVAIAEANIFDRMKD